MHLLGIDSANMNATEFYDKCDMYNKGMGDGITIVDCAPSRNHNRTTINEKCSCCAEILHIQDAKYMKDSFFLCKELIPGYLCGVTGEYTPPRGYFVNEDESEEFDKGFSFKEKLKLPGQLF